MASAEAQTAASKTSRSNSTATASGTITGTVTRRNSRFSQTNKAGNTIYARPGQVDGVVARAIRSGNPLQMINPFAPAAYGDGRDVTRHEVSDPYQRPQGIKLATVEF